MNSQILFKYYTINEYSLNVIKTGKVWMSDPTSFNDPYDCALSIDMKSYHKRNSDFYSIVRDVMLGIRDKSEIPMNRAPIPGWVINVANYEFKKEQNKFGVCCFSETNKSILMWSHYADHHKGVCIGFEFPEGSIERSQLYKVNYSNEFPKVTFEEYRGFSIQELQNNIRQLITIKANDWSYEKEWRLIHDNKNTHYPQALKIDSILLGAKSDEKVKYKILDLIKESPCKLSTAALHYNSFEIDTYL